MSLDPDAEITVVVEPVTTVAVFASQVGPVGPQWQGAWSPLVTYYPTDLVTRNGSVWIATAENTGIDPAVDPSRNEVASLVAQEKIPLGSPQSVASGFTVDRGSNVVAVGLAQAFTAVTSCRAGIASDINVPNFGIIWLGSGAPDPQGYVMLDEAAVLSPGVRYWLVIDDMASANAAIDQGPDVIGTHMAWSGEFSYGTTEPTTALGVYALPARLYGTTTDDAWQLYLQGTP